MFFHPAMCHVALGWHAIGFAQTSAILESYFLFRFRPYHCSRHVILHPCKIFIQIGPPTAEKWRVGFQDGRSTPSWILEVPWWVLWKAHVRLPIGRQ